MFYGFKNGGGGILYKAYEVNKIYILMLYLQIPKHTFVHHTKSHENGHAQSLDIFLIFFNFYVGFQFFHPLMMYPWLRLTCLAQYCDPCGHMVTNQRRRQLIMGSH